MTNQEHVLILGEPSDPLVPKWQTLCEEAGHLVTLFLDRESELLIHADVPISILLNTHVEMPFFHLQQLPDVLEERLDPDCLCLTNALTELPTGTALEFQQPEKVVGYSAIGLYSGVNTVELAPPMQAGATTLSRAQAFLGSLGLETIEVPETPGLILGRILAMLVNEAASALMEGVASPQDIDTAMKLGTNYPEGPLTWGDHVGLDVIWQILNHLEDQYGDERYCPMVLLTRMVDAGKLGRKSGEGFYSYHPEAMMR